MQQGIDVRNLGVKDCRAETEEAAGPEALDRCRQLLEIQSQIVQLADENRLIEEACENLRRQLTPEFSPAPALPAYNENVWQRLRRYSAGSYQRIVTRLEKLLRPGPARRPVAYLCDRNPFDSVES